MKRPLLNFSSVIYLIAIYIAFFASGASCLTAEVTWNRMLIVVVGNSMSATALIIVVFMGGLGLGSYIAGRVIARRRPSLVIYLLLEVAIGAYILLSPSLFALFSHTFSALAERVNDSISLSIVRLMVTLGALLLPTLLMGATFPAMISGAALDSPSKRTARTGFLYSINTLGGAVGCFVAGYHLLLEFGVQTTLIFACCLNVVAALCALVANMIKQPAPEEAAVGSSSVNSPVPDEGTRRFLKVATFGIGFVALAYEVVLTRLGIIYLGNTISVFALVLTGFLLGTGISAVLGTWIYGVLQNKTKHSNKLFSFIALAAGAFVIGTPYYLLSSASMTYEHRFEALLVIIVPTVLIGALLPVAIRMLQPGERGEATREAATLYALNTAGGLLGAGLINHFLVPLIGLKGVLICLASICVAVGIASLFPPRRSYLRWFIAALGIASIAAILAVSLPNMMYLYAGKIKKSDRGTAEVLLHREGRAANVDVLEQKDPRWDTFRDMYLNGVEEASTRYWHTQLFKLLGALPVMVHESDKPKDVLVIAFGAGITAGSVLASDQVASLDVVDLNPDIEGINNLFTGVNGDVFHKPRFHFHNDDGRNYLVTSGKKYDVIISDSTHPRAYDSWILYTQEFYQSVKARLLPGGVFAQWVPVNNDMQGRLFAIHLNTFRSVFPNATFWYVYGSDQAFLLSTPRPFTLDARLMQQKLDRLPEWFRAQYYQIDTVARLAGFFWLDESSMSQMIGDQTRVNTDDLHYFDKQSALWPLPPEWRLPRYQADIIPYLGSVNPKLLAAIGTEQKMAQLMSRYYFYNDYDYLLAAYCLNPQNGNVRFWVPRAFPQGLPEGACK